MKSSIGSITTKNWLKFRIRLAGWQRQTCPNSNILSRWRNIIVLNIKWEFIKAWIQIAVPDSDHRDEASHDLDPQISATVTSAHHDVSPPSMHHTAAQSWFSFYNGMVSSIELDIEWRSHALSQPVSIPDGLKRFVSFTTSGSSSSPTCELTIN